LAIFVDTSALFAVISETDEHSAPAVRYFDQPSVEWVTHNGIVMEASGLMQRRLGIGAVRDLLTRVVPLVEVRMVDREIHLAGVASYLAGSGRKRSLVDHLSFELMRRDGLHTAFTFDQDFSRAGFTVVP
jgi:uncharacterized protein